MSRAEPTRFGCPEFRRQMAVSRRGFLHAGMMGLAGLSLADVLRSDVRAAADPRRSRGKTVIILWMRRGRRHHAAVEYRGAFGAMRTRVPGIQICDLLPMSARLMDKWSILRSLYHTDAGHSSGDQICFTGYPAAPNVPAEGPGNVMPSCGSIVARQLQNKKPKLPAYVMIPRMVPGAGAAYLGNACDPFETIADPARDGAFTVPNFTLPKGVSLQRLDERGALLAGFDNLRREVDQGGQLTSMDQFQQRAWDLLTGREARAAFDLDAEPPAVRERYGFIPEFKAPTPDRCGVPAWSQRMLLARRLVEAGVRLVTVDLRWWDTHVQGFDTMRNGFLPRWDRAYSALIEDLHQRGLLKTTMVIAWGEFGRTPKVNEKAGRDHWPNVFSAAITGGGIQGGRVIGSSDDKGGEPASNPKTPQDVLATLYRHLGVDTTAQYQDLSGRPHPVLPSGTPIDELFA